MIPSIHIKSMHDNNTQALLQAVMLGWLPARICEDIKAVHYESSPYDMSEKLKIEFKNGGVSPALRVEQTDRVIVEPIKVLDSDEDFDYWLAHCCMIAGPERVDGDT